MRNKIKICHIQLLPLMSGVQRSMLDIFKNLDCERYDITVICKEEGELTKTLTQMGIDYLLVPQLTREIRPIRDLVSFFLLYKIFRKFKFDLIHTHSSKTGFIGRWAAHFAGRSLILHTVHGFPFHEFSGKTKTKIYSMLERLGAVVSTKIIFVNNEEREFAIANNIIPKAKALTVYNGVDHEFVQSIIDSNLREQIRQKWGVGKEKIVIGFVGRLWQQKDPVTLYNTIKACKSLKVTFVIIGDGPYRYLFEDASLDVILQGWVKNPMEYYPAIDILIQPSLWEGLPMTVIEALAFGKPVVASDIKGNRECVQHNVNGFICQPRTPEDFKKAIQTLAEDKDLFRRMGREARNQSLKIFDVTKNFAQIASLYKELLERSNYAKNS